MEVAKKKDLKVFYSPGIIDLSSINAIYLPEVSCSFVIDDDDDINKKQINMDRFVDLELLQRSKQKNRFARRCLSSLYEGVQKGFDDIYERHNELEKYYIESMDFNKNINLLNSVKKEIFLD